MISCAIRVLVIVDLMCVSYGCDESKPKTVEHTKIWGEIDFPDRDVFGACNHKFPIPLLRREYSVTYPWDFTQDWLPIIDVIRGIKHVDKSKGTCVPTTEITEGGLGQKTATVKITSERNCGLDSSVWFVLGPPDFMDFNKFHNKTNIEFDPKLPEWD